MSQRGVLVATDSQREWLLSWWWERYSSYNSLPVVFVDLGMSLEAKTWCEERGTVLVLQTEEKETSEIPSQWLAVTDYTKKQFETARKAWFKKPHACLLSPFKETIWIDLDCEVLGPLEGAFDFLGDKEMAVKFLWIGNKMPEGLQPAVKAGTVCNTGVVVFRKESLLLQLWAEKSCEESHLHWGDDSLLSLLIAGAPEKVNSLPEIYNWHMSQGLPLEVMIVHWVGEWGKLYIAKHGGIKKTLAQLWSS